MVKNYINFLRISLFFLFLLVIPNTIYAQCAGDDGALTVCDIPAASSKTINLFAQLTGSPLSGGVWTDLDGSGGLDSDTGILNAQLITQSGKFRYLYTVDGIGLCRDNEAIVTVTIGGYSGVTSPNVSVCSAVQQFNLFSAFNGLYLGPQSNGKWHNDTTNQYVDPVINVTDTEGTFQYTYTMPAIGTCSAMSSTAVVTIFKAPKSGKGSNLGLCATDGLTGYTDYDLNNLLSNQDPGGTWTDVNNTGELTFVGDHNVNVQRIYNTRGLGNYFFTYTVKSKNPICSDVATTVRITLEQKLDFTGAKLKIDANNICETEIPTATYTATITKGPAVIPNGDYNVSFTVSGPNGGSETLPGNFINGVFVFPLKSEYFQKVGSYNVVITNLYATNSERACQNIFNLSEVVNIFPIPDLAGAKITPVNTCQNTDTPVNITDAVKIVDGTYTILYNISGVNNASSQTATATFAGGNATFSVPAILNAQSGNGTIQIVKITHTISGCTNNANVQGTIVVNPLPNASNVRIQATTVCFGSAVTASVSGLGTLTDVTVSYSLSGANVATVQMVVLKPVSGNASFVIPAALLANTGSTTITVSNLKNNITGCEIAVNGTAAIFSINPIPVAPTVSDQSFCKSENATIGNLVPNGTQFKWYNSPTLTTPLANTYVLKSETYYVTETTLSCTSTATMFKVIIRDTPAPELNTNGQNFCGLNAPTIADLSNNTNVPSSVVWYDAPKNGYLLPASTPLVDQKKYYGFDFSTTENCLSYDSLEVVVSLTDCDVVPPDFFIPDGFSPNGDGVNDTFVIPNIDFLFPDYYLQIFNRYGNRMYEGFKDKAGWDGTNWQTDGFAHGIAPNGVYFYTLQFNKGNKPPIQGRLYLNR
ncbi:gliding motility-associated C-terminal domain-containing protein [Flavobacterium daemonense]|uniref:gliding motility-associated C-terminal domain-containing protein n=1 Tax=Flavobacterium daemonense TaxID=1393049 RepID=UPI0011863C05|nr:gliding motility-associated C-terminal domain-containing protein [Flavobacterium daemonense]KAF2335120.1 gliding motility-associated C-terminal domain-containing protein [Flavobacterium daemonense]